MVVNLLHCQWYLPKIRKRANVMLECIDYKNMMDKLRGCIHIHKGGADNFRDHIEMGKIELRLQWKIGADPVLIYKDSTITA